MKTVLFVLFGFLTVHSFGQKGVIQGYVHERLDNIGIPYVQVWLVDTKIVTWTDSTGFFRLDRIPIGIYDLRFSRVGRKDTTIQQLSVVDDKAINISTSLGYCKYNNSIHNNTCPVCHKKNKVIPIIDGYPGKKDFRKEKRGKIKLGGDDITDCEPNW